MTAPPSSKLLRELHQKRERHKRRSKFYRVAFAIAGVFVALGGIGLVALPGPAFVVIPIGLAMLALEFDWAERMLVWAVRRGQEAKQSAKGLSKGQKILIGTGVIILAIVAIKVVVLFDVPLLPDS